MSSSVLVVEDDFLIRAGAVRIAKDFSGKVYEAANADEAIEILKRFSDVTLLFTDVDMPGSMDGLELARLVHQRWPHIHLVVTSGHISLSGDDIPDDGRFIAKPYHAEAVHKMFREASS